MSARGHSVVAVILALGVAISVCSLALAAAIAEASQHLTISETAATLLSTALGALVGAVATYLGVRVPEPPPVADDYGGSESARGFDDEEPLPPPRD